jgi:hypothetical protein
MFTTMMRRDAQVPSVTENPCDSVGSHAPQPLFEVDDSALVRVVEKNPRHVLNLLHSDVLPGRQALGRKELVLEELAQVTPVRSIRCRSHDSVVVVVVVQDSPHEPPRPRRKIRIVALEQLLRHFSRGHHDARH